MKMRPFFRRAVLLGLLPLVVFNVHPAQAGSATWNLNPTSGDWNTAGNWTPATVPNSAADTATFDLSNQKVIFLSASVTANAIIFNPAASAYSVTTTPTHTLTLSGVGIVNNSGLTQNFVADWDESGLTTGTMNFTGSANVGTASNFTINGGQGPFGTGGQITFGDTCNAANAAFTITASDGMDFGLSLGELNFYDSASAADATIVAHGGVITFSGTAVTAGNANIITNGNSQIYFLVSARGGNSTITTGPGFGITVFSNSADAEHMSLTNNGGSANGQGGYYTEFNSSSTAGDGLFINNGAAAAGAFAASMLFGNGFATSTAGNATLIANGGTNGGPGGLIRFADSTTGGTARIEVFGNGGLDISARTAPGITTGSIEGDGLVFLGARNLTVGSNDLATTFSGIIQDGGVSGGSGGGVTKTGHATFTLANSNTYTGTTTVNQGTLVVSNTTGSATGSGAVRVNSGNLGGSGMVSGAVTVGTGAGSGAFLAPAAGTNVRATFTTSSSVTLNADATYTYTAKANARRAQTDNVVANGVTINGATFSFRPKVKGALQAGTVFTVISNTSANPIAGTFSNLPDGAIVTVNGNNLQASYSGGDGNDLTLTVVP